LAARFEAHPDVAKALRTWQGKTIIDVTNAYGVGLSGGGLLVQARGNSWGQLVFKNLVKFDAKS
jgi:predicted dinucleotide-binding enzyme